MTDNWLTVDRQGLKKLMAGRGKGFVLSELIQNAWDGSGAGNVSRVDVSVTATTEQAERGLVQVAVEDDDPNGFADLGHSYTMFAESTKKDDPTQRGRFNSGEKMVLAICQNAVVSSTKGTVAFHEDGTRQELDERRDRGSIFSALVEMTPAEMQEVLDELERLIVPEGIATFLNGTQMVARKPLRSFEETLITMKADDEGVLRRTRRRGTVNIHSAHSEEGWIYELGIPVVEIGGRFDVDVQQKVPLNSDRDNVTPAYLRSIRTAVLNNTADLLDVSDTTATWVKDAMEDKNVDIAAVKQVVTTRFGDRVAKFDPSDVEASHRLVAQGTQVLGGNTFSSAAWDNIKRAEAIRPAGQIAPSRPTAGDLADQFKAEEWDQGMAVLAEFTKEMARRLLDGREIQVIFTRDSQAGYHTKFGDNIFIYNLGRLGKVHANGGLEAKQISTLAGSLAHAVEGDHLTEGYHSAVTDFTGRLVVLALRQPDLFKPDTYVQRMEAQGV